MKQGDKFDLSVEIEVPVGMETAFGGFVRRIDQWWPREYTWSRELLEQIAIEAKPGGACYEIGPHRFRCDWGRVTHYSEPEEIAFLWQIGPQREPVPDPEKASEVLVSFQEKGMGSVLHLQHRHFENHGEAGSWYRDAMASPEGWPKILERYGAYMAK